jgi:peptidoglycan/LPS O-acetylase OafA/YrhL
MVFLRHRITRIVPLYWLVTTAKIAAILALPTLVMRTQLDWGYVLSSYALLPVHDVNGDFKPVLPVGWTLTYEMFFYVLVAVALYMRQPILRVAGPVLAIVYLLGLLGSALWPGVAHLGVLDFANPIVVEFLYGVMIALALRRGRRLPTGVAAFSLICGAALIVTVPVISGVLRPFTWGLPAAMMVAGAVALETVLTPWIPRWLLVSGDASYATYLTHGFVVPAVGIVVLHLGVSGGDALAAVVIGGVVISGAVGWVAHVLLERPILALFRRRRPPVPLAANT